MTVRTNQFLSGAAMIPHPDKAYKGGEDAFYNSSRVLAVADGVGGWNSKGIDPRFYSQKLCTNVGSFSVSDWENVKTNPKQLIEHAWKNNQEGGSSTLVVLTIPETGAKIYASYVGDSGYMVFRPSITGNSEKKLVCSSEPQQHELYDCPFQLGWSEKWDRPEVALSYEHTVQDGDIVVVGSDGIFDNLEYKNVGDIVQEYLDGQKKGMFDAGELAALIAKRTFDVSLDKEFDSPFSVEARRLGKTHTSGGKSDDITVVVGKVYLAGSK